MFIVMPRNSFQVAPIPNRHLVASWSETGKVHIWDVGAQINALDTPGSSKNQQFGDKVKPIFTFAGHQVLFSESHLIKLGN